MKILSALLILCFVLSLMTGCISSCETQNYKKQSQSLTLMTFNVENLFDNADDPGKNDETYLSLGKKQSLEHRNKCKKMGRGFYKKQCFEKDWSDFKVEEKLKRLADVILQVKKGMGPDILLLQEVENISILERLRTTKLKKAGYQPAILIEGPDQRGIDVAILSRLPLIGKAQLNPIDLTRLTKDPRWKGRMGSYFNKRKNKKLRPTRGILQAQLKLPGGEKLNVFALHFPSQGNPLPFRELAVETLNELQETLPKEELAIAGGDFNITAKEEVNHHLFAKTLGARWSATHYLGCKKCPGTHNYRGKWSFLDAILFSKNFEQSHWQVDRSSIRLVNKSIYQVSEKKRPARFNDGKDKIGVSDHWPVAVEIKKVL